MNNCNISINAPIRILKGAGLINTSFLPAWVYKLNITLTNVSDTSQLCSFNVTLGNGIRYMKNLQLSGPDKHLLHKINVVEPNTNVGNNNVVVFANNFIILPHSENIITFDISLYDKYTENSLENSGEKIPHDSKIYFSGHLLNEEYVSSFKSISKTRDYEIIVKCEDTEVACGDTTKFYIECKAGQYDMVRSVYIRSILDDGLVFISDSSNIEPRNVYTFDKTTILKWNLGSLLPSEVKKIGYKVSINNQYSDERKIQSGEILKNKTNSNCINNSTYTQCPLSYQYMLTIK